MDSMATATKRVHFDPSFEEEEERRRINSLAREEAKNVGPFCRVASLPPTSTVGRNELTCVYLTGAQRNGTTR